MPAPTILSQDSFADWRTKINQTSTILNTLSNVVGTLSEIDLPSQDRTSIVEAINTVIAIIGEMTDLTGHHLTATDTLTAVLVELADRVYSLENP